MAQNLDFSWKLYNAYEQFEESSFTKQRFKHNDILSLIDDLKKNEMYKVEKRGESFEGREVYLIKFGNGAKKVFLWSQMHGDESTATMALFDMFNFFNAEGEFEEYKKKILEGVTIYIMPMVNPDGAELFTRRNALDIDINRDAVRLQSPESQILMNAFKDIGADFGFNLHDQSVYYGAGMSFKQATISFLAPAYNYEKEVNESRANAMKLIVQLNTVLEEYIPGHIGRYSDDYEPRAFGDMFSSLGTSTILVESGGWKDDPEKQFIRKINFILMMSSLYEIAASSYVDVPLELYEKIPKNEEALMELLLREVTVKRNDKDVIYDVGIRQRHRDYQDDSEFYFQSYVDDIGDLSVYYGLDELDCKGLTLNLGKCYPKVFNTIEEVLEKGIPSIYADGCTTVMIKEKPDELPYSTYPINISIGDEIKEPENERYLRRGMPANFVLSDANGIRYVVVNGFLFDVRNTIGEIKNGLYIR